MSELTHSEKEVWEQETMKKKSFTRRLRTKERADEEEGGRASVLTVTATSLKESIIAAGAHKRKWGRENRESTIITEGEGASRMQMISGKEKVEQEGNI